MKFAKFLRKPYFTEHPQWLLLTVSGFQIPAKIFFLKFGKFLRTSYDRTPPDDGFLSLYVNFDNFFRIFHRAPLRNYLFHVQVAKFQPADTVKGCFAGAFQEREVDIQGVHLLKIFENYL